MDPSDRCGEGPGIGWGGQIPEKGRDGPSQALEGVRDSPRRRPTVALGGQGGDRGDRNLGTAPPLG